MKLFFALCFLLTLLLITTYTSAASLSAKARAAIALSQVSTKKSDCGCGGSCACCFGECGSKHCPSANNREHKFILQAAAAAAFGENKPLLVWIAEACPPCEVKLKDCHHVHVPCYEGNRGLETAPSVLVCYPNTDGGFNVVKRINDCPTDLVEQVRQALPKPVPAPRAPVFIAPPMSPMMPVMSGFGGGGGC